MSFKTVIVIPAFNEEKRISSTLHTVHQAGYYDIVVVDDGSTDTTFARASQITTTLQHVINRGMGAALATGTAWALEHGADCIVHFDADGQHQAGEIERVVAPIMSGEADIVLGSRYLQPSHTPWTKKFLLHTPALFVQNLMTGLPLTDVHNGFRALRRTAARQIQIQQDRMAHASEIIGEIKRNRLRFVEVPVTISYHEYGQGFAAGLKIYADLIMRKIFK